MKLKRFLELEQGKLGGLTLRAVARKAKVNESTVWRAAVGKGIRLSSAVAISRACGKNKAGRPNVAIEDLQQIEMEV